jgi:hypothetical protein
MVAVVSRAYISIPAILRGGWWCFHTPFSLTFFLLVTAEEDLGPNIWYSSQIILWYLWQRGIEYFLYGTGPKDSYSPAGEVSVWLVDAPPPSRSASRLRNARRCWRGNAPPRLRRGVPDGAGLFCSSVSGEGFGGIGRQTRPRLSSCAAPVYPGGAAHCERVTRLSRHGGAR